MLGQVEDLDRLSSRCTLTGNQIWFGLLTNEGRVLILDLPRALKFLAQEEQADHGLMTLTLKNSPRVELYGLQGLPCTYFW